MLGGCQEVVQVLRRERVSEVDTRMGLDIGWLLQPWPMTLYLMPLIFLEKIARLTWLGVVDWIWQRINRRGRKIM